MVQFITKNKWLIIGFIGLLFCGSLWLVPQLRTNVNFSDFFPRDNNALAYQNKITKNLGSNDHFIAIAIVPERSIFNFDFLNRVDQFTRECKKITNIESASSITNSSRYIKSLFGYFPVPYIHLDQKEKLKQDSIIIYKNYATTHPFIASNASSVSVIVKLKENIDFEKYDSVVTDIEKLLKSYQFHETHVMGKKLIEVHYNRILNSELASNILMSVGIIVLLLFMIYKSLKEVLIPMITVLVTLMIFYGIFVLMGWDLGIMSSLFPTIIIIVGISDCIHILTKYNLEVKNSQSTNQAISLVIQEVGLSIFLTSLTTIIGFMTLATSSLPALHNFGIEASIGVILAFIISILLLPAILLVLPFKFKKLKSTSNHYWSRVTRWIYMIIIDKKSLVLGIIILCLLISTIGISSLNTNNRQLSNIPNNHSLKKDYIFFDNELGGARTFELIIELKDSSSMYQEKNLTDIKKLVHYLNDIPSIGYIMSPITYYHSISKLYNTNLDSMEISITNNKVRAYENWMLQNSKNQKWRLVDENHKLGRITARMPDLGRNEVKKLNAKIKNWINREMDLSRMNFQFVGMDLLSDMGHEFRIKNMIWGIILALIAVSFLIGLLFKQIKMVIITLIANIIPLIIIAGLMGFFGIELRGTTSIIFAVGFVIVVDDTIHFLSKFRIELKKGNSIEQSIKTTLLETGKAILTTSLVLFGGFIVLLNSAFGDIYAVGFMVSLMILFALFLDLFLVPVLLLLIFKTALDD